METDQYDGSILVHSRSIIAAKEVAEKTGESATPLSLKKDLAEFLSFVSIHALGTKIYYDSSIPREFADRTEQAIGDLGLSTTIKPSQPPDPDRFESDVTAAVELATPLFKVVTKQPKSKAHHTSQDRAEVFFQNLGSMAKEKSEKNRRSIALEAYNSNVMGGKILVGLSDLRNEAMLRELSILAKYAPSERQIYLLPDLVNHFRYFLLSRWSGNWRSLYATNEETEQVGALYRKMVWPLIVNTLRLRAEKAGLPFPENIQQRDKLDQVLPLVGLVVLLEAEPGDSPIHLFSRAESLADRVNLKSLQKQIINLQAEYDGGTAVDDIADELWNRILEAGGLKRILKKDPVWKRAIHRLWPAIAADTAIVTTTMTLLSELDLAKLLIILGSGGVIRFVCYLQQLLREQGQATNYLAVLSHLLAVAEKVSEEQIIKKVQVVWKRELLVD